MSLSTRVAIVVTTGHIDEIKGVDKAIDESVMATLPKAAERRLPLSSAPRTSAQPVFIFVALMDRFGALDSICRRLYETMHRSLALLAALTLVACGNTTDQKSTSGDDGGSDSADDASYDAPSPVPVVCGSTTCTAGDFCVVSCTGNPFYCDVPVDAGVCPSGEHLTTSCGYGPGAQLDGGGCSNVAYSYVCNPLSPGQTTYMCPNLGSMPINASGVVTCCSD